MSKLKFFSSKEFLRTIIIIIITGIILFILLVFFLKKNTRHGDFVVVPNMIGKNMQEFKSKASELDLELKVFGTASYNPNFKINSVLDQNPKPNAKVKRGRKIYLTLNASDFEMVEIPKIIGKTRREAESTIRSLGFVFGDIEKVNYIAKDEVISISHEGNELKEGDLLKKTSVIDFVLGNGKQ